MRCQACGKLFPLDIPPLANSSKSEAIFLDNLTNIVCPFCKRKRKEPFEDDDPRPQKARRQV